MPPGLWGALLGGGGGEEAGGEGAVAPTPQVVEAPSEGRRRRRQGEQEEEEGMDVQQAEENEQGMGNVDKRFVCVFSFVCVWGGGGGKEGLFRRLPD